MTDDIKALIERVALPWLEEAEQSFDTDELAKAGQAVRDLLKAYQERGRTPAPEGEAWRTVPVEPTEAMIEAANALSGPGTGVNYVQLDPEDFYAAMLAASPVVPAPEGEPVACTACEGRPVFPNVPCAVCAASPVVPVGSSKKDVLPYGYDQYGRPQGPPAPVVPVGVRERVLDELDGAWLHGQRRTSWRRDESADAILAALRRTDTGREG
jgi:hypothetical protein